MLGKLFGKVKNKAMGALLQKQLGHLPKEQQDVIMKMIEENPDFFKKIEQETKELMKNGGNEMYASMQIMAKYKDEFAKLAQAMHMGGMAPKGTSAQPGASTVNTTSETDTDTAIAGATSA